MLKLTDPEKQEIIRYLEANKPLPEKYRFLLFEDKREAGVEWQIARSLQYRTAIPDHRAGG